MSGPDSNSKLWDKDKQPTDLTNCIISEKKDPISGGFGVVYKGRIIDSSSVPNHLPVDQPVAIKVIMIRNPHSRSEQEQMESSKRVNLLWFSVLHDFIVIIFRGLIGRLVFGNGCATRTFFTFLVFLMASVIFLHLSLNGKATVGSSRTSDLLFQSKFNCVGTIMDYLHKTPNANRYQLLQGVARGLAFLHGQSYLLSFD